MRRSPGRSRPRLPGRSVHAGPIFPADATCSLLAYLGPPLRLGSLLGGQEHSLVVQSYRPREMISGTVDADGFGVGWYIPEVDPTPVRYASTAPIWADANLESLGRKLSAACL
jgi:glutamine amidotransferase